MDPYCEAIAKLLVKDGQAAPRTLTRIMENLPYSRFTILRHLREMEVSGLISKSTIARTSMEGQRCSTNPPLRSLEAKPPFKYRSPS